jgi:hypothetical protein
VNIRTTALNRLAIWRVAALAVVAFAIQPATPALAGDDNDEFKFDLVSSSPNILPHAHGRVRVESVGPVEVMNVTVWGLPPNTDFDFFVIQVPHGPFGLSWYQGDVETNRFGVGFGRFVGRFNDETFIVAPGAASAPTPRTAPPFPDANANPPTLPVQTYHLGLWFNSPQDAEKAGFAPTITPFNSEHHAGLQVLNSSNFPDNEGPLFHVKPAH